MKYTEIKDELEVLLFGKYRFMIINKVEKSYTKVRILDIYRGKGWNESLQRYTGYISSRGWARGENYSYGKTTIAHIKDLELIK